MIQSLPIEIKNMNFNRIMDQVRQTTDTTVIVPENWGQGRATFGGLVAAMMYEKIPTSISQDRVIRSIMLSFVAPVAPGEMDVIVTVLRSGKSATQVQISAYQNDAPCAVMLASFGGARESTIKIDYNDAPATKAPESVADFPFIPKVTPDFTQHFDYRFTEGTMPFMGSTQNTMGGWIKLKDPCNQPINVPQILALLDAWPPATLSLLKAPAAGSSLTWSMSFIDSPQTASANHWWQYEAKIKQAQDGYSHIDATMWDENGKAIVMSHQTVSVFA